ncbi:unnamed protein product, partial [Adineta steineri]
MNSLLTPTNLCSQCASFFVQSIRYLPQSLQSITNEALKQFSPKRTPKQHSRRDIDRKVVRATQQAFNIKIESLLNELSKEEFQKLTIAPLSPCLSCQIGLTQHVTHKDLLKVENLLYTQVRGFKTRHATSTGVRGDINDHNISAGSASRNFNDFDGYRLSASNTGRQSQYPNDSNQPPLTAFVNRFLQYARGNSGSQNIDAKRFQDILHTTTNPDDQQKVKIAFA